MSSMPLGKSRPLLTMFFLVPTSTTFLSAFVEMHAQCYLEPSAPQLITVCTSPAVIVHDPVLSNTRCQGDGIAASSSVLHPIESTGWCRCGRQCDLPPPSYDEVQGQEADIEPVDSSVNGSD
jgi:hypothetical protein